MELKSNTLRNRERLEEEERLVGMRKIHMNRDVLKNRNSAIKKQSNR
jgi:hypothetical protein